MALCTQSAVHLLSERENQSGATYGRKTAISITKNQKKHGKSQKRKGGEISERVDQPQSGKEGKRRTTRANKRNAGGGGTVL